MLRDVLVTVYTTNGEELALILKERKLVYEDVRLTFEDFKLSLTAIFTPICAVSLKFPRIFSKDVKVLSDAWERSYAEMGWKNAEQMGDMPWYFLANDGEKTYAYGVEVQPNAMCSWRLHEEHVELYVDLRSGKNPLMLAGRTIDACTVLAKTYTGDTFDAMKDFCTLMCPSPRLPKEVIYGGNDWYCDYGNNSGEKMLKMTRKLVKCVPENAPKPYMIIDEGWEINKNVYAGFIGGPWRGNKKFGDIKLFAEKLEELGVKPGIWIRPLQAYRVLPEGCYLHFSEREEDSFLDPSVDEVIKYIKNEVKYLKDCGFKLIKTDFLTFDICHKWGFEMADGFAQTADFCDKSRTTAEIVLALHRAIREAAGDDVYILGCNALNHLCAGIFELQRIGDDVSGLEWDRTVRMGANTLTYRLAQDEAFFAADADCVPITSKIPWALTEKWMSLVAKSGTVLFVSLSDDVAFDEKVENAVKKAFKAVIENDKSFRPLDWMTPHYRKIKDSFGYDTVCALSEKWYTSQGEISFSWNDENI